MISKDRALRDDAPAWAMIAFLPPGKLPHHERLTGGALARKLPWMAREEVLRVLGSLRDAAFVKDVGGGRFSPTAAGMEALSREIERRAGGPASGLSIPVANISSATADYAFYLFWIGVGARPEVPAVVNGRGLPAVWDGPHLPAPIDRRTLNKNARIALVDWDRVWAPREDGTPRPPHNTPQRDPEELVP